MESNLWHTSLEGKYTYMILSLGKSCRPSLLEALQGSTMERCLMYGKGKFWLYKLSHANNYCPCPFQLEVVLFDCLIPRDYCANGRHHTQVCLFLVELSVDLSKSDIVSDVYLWLIDKLDDCNHFAYSLFVVGRIDISNHSFPPFHSIHSPLQENGTASETQSPAQNIPS